jgi:phage terminase large subunit GpA-like protein
METDQRFFFCPCQSCGHWQTLRWSQVQWPEGKPEDARYVCDQETCGYHHTDEQRIAMIEVGEWRATAPFKGRAGFFLNGIYSVSPAQRGCVSKLHQMAKDFVRANARGKESLRAWVNTFLCECFEDQEAQNVDPDLLFNRRETYGPKLPPKVAILTGGMDVHPDRIEIQVVGWGEGEECWPVDYHVHMFDTSNKEMIHALLLAAMDKTYEHPGGREISITRLCADTGNRTDETHYACQKLAMRGVIPVKGKPLEGAPVLYLPRREGKARRRLWLVSTNAAKSLLYSRFTLKDHGPGYVHFPSDREPHFGKEYFKQVTAESLYIETKMGREIRRFDLPSGARNEALDTFIYALAALRYDTSPNFGKMLARLMAEQNPPEEPPQQERRSPALARGGFGTGWRV